MLQSSHGERPTEFSTRNGCILSLFSSLKLVAQFAAPHLIWMLSSLVELSLVLEYESAAPVDSNVC